MPSRERDAELTNVRRKRLRTGDTSPVEISGRLARRPSNDKYNYLRRARCLCRTRPRINLFLSRDTEKVALETTTNPGTVANPSIRLSITCQRPRERSISFGTQWRQDWRIRELSRNANRGAERASEWQERVHVLSMHLWKARLRGAGGNELETCTTASEWDRRGRIEF